MENPKKLHVDDISEKDFERIAQVGIVAIDCEMGGLNPYRDNLYMVQLAELDGTIHILRAKEWDRARVFKKFLIDENITKVFHFAIMDCAFLMHQFHDPVNGAYCTKIASKIARTYSSSHSLSTLIKEFFNITLDKDLQKSFWGSAEVSSSQLEYASNDVKYLLKIKGCLEKILMDKGSLPSGISYLDLNQKCQATIPLLIHLWINGWDFGKEDPDSIFGR
jgi:ribonuclease D